MKPWKRAEDVVIAADVVAAVVVDEWKFDCIELVLIAGQYFWYVCLVLQLTTFAEVIVSQTDQLVTLNKVIEKKIQQLTNAAVNITVSC